MKAGVKRFMLATALAALVGMVGVTPIFAQISFTDFTSTTGLTLNGNAAAAVNGQNMNVLRLTPNQTYQAGSAWFNTQQPVSAPFSTTFTFQLAGFNTGFPADGIAFLIQNSPSSPAPGALAALGPDGCSLGFGGNPNCQGPGTGISNSLAVELDTFQNEDDPNGNHVSIQSCLTAPNSTDSGACRIADNSNLLDGNGQTINLSDGNPHTVTVTYTPSTLSNCGPNQTSSCSSIDVILDGTDLFPNGGVLFDLTTIGLNSGAAWVGFTAATGGGDNNQDIQSWTFMPGSQSGTISTAAPTVLAFQGGTQNNAYDYNAQLTAGGVTSATGTVNPIVISQQACNKLVQKSFPFTQCFVYKNAGIVNGQSVDGSVLFELTCPGPPFFGECGNPQAQDFFAELGSDFTFTYAENLGFHLLASTIGPYPGWLKGTGPNVLSPCTAYPNNSPALFQSNQIDSFSYFGDPGGKTVGKSGGGASCWVATYATSGELPPGIKVTAPTFTTYTKSSTPLTASYTCSNPSTSQASTSPTGPYLAVASCTQSQTPNPNNLGQNPGCVAGSVCTGKFDVSVKGIHVFTVTAKDTGGNVNVNVVVYNVH